MTNYQRRGSSRERDQEWNDRPRSREDRWDDEGRSARSGYEQHSAYEPEGGDVDYDRELDERGLRARGSEGERYENGGERDWRERERSGRDRSWGREGSFGRESGWGNESRPWGNEGRSGRESYGAQGGMGRQRESFGGRDASWRYGGSAYEPYYRAGRGRSEERGGSERDDWRSQGSSYGGGSNYGGSSYSSGPRMGSNYGYGSSIGSGVGSYGGSQQRQGWRGSQSSREMSGRTGQHAGKGPKDFRRSDERLREEISEHLMADPDIDASELTVNVKDGEVTLEGSVPDRQTKRDCEDCAENVLGVRQVNNRLRVSESSSRGSGTSLNRGYEMGSSQRGQQSSQSGQSGQSGQTSQQTSHQAGNRITGKGDNV